MNTFFPIQGFVQHYHWGGYSFIPELLNQKNPDKKPYAELWMGTHAQGPNHIVGSEMNLDQCIAENPEKILGGGVVKKFGPYLPFLFKVLDAREMLSIQAHPSQKEAREGFARENTLGIPLDAKNRSYRDENYKPEVMVALTDFWLVQGFRSSEEIKKILSEVPELSNLSDSFLRSDLRFFFQKIMEMSQEDLNVLLTPLLQRIESLKSPHKHSPEYWIKKSYADKLISYEYLDRGIILLYLMNIVNLKPGEGMFQDAGVLHAYMEGVNMELSVNSDNVLRGGMTSKYINIPELMKVAVIESAVPEIILPRNISDCECVYPSKALEFELRKYVLHSTSYSPATSGPQILLVIEGEGKINENKIKKGDSFFVPDGTQYELSSEKILEVFCARVPGV